MASTYGSPHIITGIHPDFFKQKLVIPMPGHPEPEQPRLEFPEIKGAFILETGSGISVDDITQNDNMTFVPSEIIPWSFEYARIEIPWPE